MLPRDELSARLPAPREDEPRELRQDIADELADHLHCAVARERLRDETLRGDNDEALRAALDRFGDPAAVARRLWWDAMKEKIMTQRLVSIMAFAAAAAGIVCCLFMWQIVQNSRDTQTALIASQREMMQALLAEFKAPHAAGAAAESDNWWPLVVKLVDEEGKPVQGTVNYASTTSAGPVSDYCDTGADGTVDFGRLPSGQYALTLAVGSDSRRMMAGQQILLGPGRKSEYTVVCPTDLASIVPLRFEFKPPEDLREKLLYYLARVSYLGRTIRGNRWQDIKPSGAVEVPSNALVVLDRSGTILGTADFGVAADLASPVINNQRFPLVIQAGNPLSPFHGVPVGKYSLTLVSCLPDPTQLQVLDFQPPSTAPRPEPARRTPALHMLWHVARGTAVYPTIVKEIDAKADSSQTCLIGGEEAQNEDTLFWEGIRKGIEENPKHYKTNPTFLTPPTAKAPDSSGPD